MDKINDSMNTITQGTYIIGTKGDDKINGMMAAWVIQISFNPNRIFVAVAKTHYTTELIEQSGCFSTNVLTERDREIAVRCGFASGRNIDKFVGVDVAYAITGAPSIKGVKVHLDCKLPKSIEAVDHILFIGDILYGKAFDGITMINHKKDFFK